MEMHQIRYFLALCETRNFTRAAERCNVTQPALTRAIQNLEHEFRGALFDRDRGAVRITPLGELVRQHLAQVDVHTAAARAAAKRFKSGSGGVLRLGVSTLVGGEALAGLLAGFVQAHASAQFELRERPQGEVMQGLSDGDHELGIISLDRASAQRRGLKPLYAERLAVFFRHGHALGAHEAVPLPALAGVPLCDRLHHPFVETVAGAMAAAGISAEVACRTDRTDWLLSLVAAGAGVAVLPEHAAALPALDRRPLAAPYLERAVVLVPAAGRTLSPLASAFQQSAEAGRAAAPLPLTAAA